VEEVVIDQAAFDARFGTETASAAPAPSSSRSPSVTPTRRAQPPVDVGSHRLPTSDGDDNRPVRPDDRDSQTPLAVYQQAVEEFNSAQYAEALSSLNTFVASGPEADYMDNALFWMGECLYGLGRYSEALGFFQRVVSEYPDGNKVPDSLLKEALTYERLDNAPRAREILATLVETYPTTDAADRAQQRLRDLE
jgi:tol-pal system protein YbgF